jgi:hypothetical protein
MSVQLRQSSVQNKVLTMRAQRTVNLGQVNGVALWHNIVHVTGEVLNRDYPAYDDALCLNTPSGQRMMASHIPKTLRKTSSMGDMMTIYRE